MQTWPYNSNDRRSIFSFSTQLINRTLHDFAPYADERRGKGGLGQLVEEIFFGYEVNSHAEADFASAGIELKCTPLKLTRQNELAIKERLVCGMINYREDWCKAFEESHFYTKCIVMLLLFYLNQDGVSRLDLRFIFVALWQIPEKDLLIMRQDYEIIINKIRNGQAHTLSEGDTMYLAACRKGQKGDSLMEQYGSTIGAPRRAWSLKMAYMRIVLEGIKHKHTNGAYSNIELEQGTPLEQLVATADLRGQRFEDIILGRFSPYMHMDYEEFCKQCNRAAAPSKQKYFLMANTIAGQGRVGNVNRSEEFLKAGLTMKTVRVQRNGCIKESMSFENIDYQEVYDCAEWLDSRLYELYSSRFLFVVFHETDGEIALSDGLRDSRYELDKVFFWTMPQADLDIAKEYWMNIRQCVLQNTISPQHFWRMTDNRLFHVRPKGRDASDLTINPNGGYVKKYCYWFNSEYVKKIIDNHNGAISVY